MKAEDLTGRTFGRLTALRRAENDAHNKARWLCRCECGCECTVPAAHLKNGHTKSCGCLRESPARNRRDLTGQRFGRLVAVEALPSLDGKAVWRCRCDCGAETAVRAVSLLGGLTKSCGCLNRETSARMHDHLRYQDNTCIERLERVKKDEPINKAGFRGLFLTKGGLYRAVITFRKVHYTLGYYARFADAVQARLDAEESLHDGYLKAYANYQARAAADPAWAEDNPFYYQVRRANGAFCVETNGYQSAPEQQSAPDYQSASD